MMSRWSDLVPVRLALAAAALVLVTAGTSRAAFITFEAAAPNAAAITPIRDAFRAAVGGGTVAGANGSFGGLRREINWDGVPDAFADPFLMPPNFFNANSPRGAVFATPGIGFMVSGNAGGLVPVLFGFPNDLQTFSPQRLFSPIGSNITDVSFFLPGTNTQVSTTAFGAFFVDVEVPTSTRMELFDANGALLYSRLVLAGGNQGLSFLGAVAGAGERISRVRLTTGSNVLIANGVLGNPTDDFVVMDDFIYAEPSTVPDVPEPATLTLAMLGLAGLLRNARARRDR